jgi:hypothetical protein
MSGRDISSNEWGRKSKAYYLNPCEAHSLETNCWSWSWSKAPAFLFLFQFSSLHCGMGKLFVSIFVFFNFVNSIRYDTICKKNTHTFCAKMETAIHELISSHRNGEKL